MSPKKKDDDAVPETETRELPAEYDPNKPRSYDNDKGSTPVRG